MKRGPSHSSEDCKAPLKFFRNHTSLCKSFARPTALSTYPAWSSATNSESPMAVSKVTPAVQNVRLQRGIGQHYNLQLYAPLSGRTGCDISICIFGGGNAKVIAHQGTTWVKNAIKRKMRVKQTYQYNGQMGERVRNQKERPREKERERETRGKDKEKKWQS